MKKLETFLLIVIVLSQSSHLVFDYTGMRADIFPFYDYSEVNPDGRHVSMLLYEISKLFALCVFTFLLWEQCINVYKKMIYFSVMVWFIIELLGYLLVFGQGTNYIGYPVFGLLIFRAWVKRKR